ncbi:hypothetical protein GJ496_011088 [Pomphorhynchus laevis]|nr:hypothetical protein GJ496_011088 [Pomphorhynchus laevis]
MRPNTEIQKSLSWIVHPAHFGWGPVFRSTHNGSLLRAFGMYESAHILMTNKSIIGFEAEIFEGMYQVYFLDLCTGETSVFFEDLLERTPSESMDMCTINGITFIKSRPQIQIPPSLILLANLPLARNIPHEELDHPLEDINELDWTENPKISFEELATPPFSRK